MNLSGPRRDVAPRLLLRGVVGILRLDHEREQVAVYTTDRGK